MSADRRARLAARETELVQALHSGPTPPGLDQRMIALASAGIARKRARQVARAFPALASALGSDYHDAFAAFARANPPRDGGAIADGLAFARVVARERVLSDAARIERAVAAAAVTTRHGRQTRRHAPHIRATLTRSPRGVVIVASSPGIGTRVLSLRPRERHHEAS